MYPARNRLRTPGIALSVLLLGACQEPTAPRWADDPMQPVGRRVAGLVSAGWTTCALADSGQLFCWGENRWGEFGNGTREPTAVPVPAGGGMRWKQVFGSMGSHLCGVTAEDVAYCWGFNSAGALGAGLPGSHLAAPARVLADEPFRVLSASLHTCGVTVSARVLCWGSRLGGQLGRPGDGSEADLPAPIDSPHAYTAVTTGMQFSCALRTTGEADCWGWGVGMGSGPGDRSVFTPAPVSGGHRFGRISAGSQWVCALNTLGAPYCWGKAGMAWPGDFRAEPEAIPTEIRFQEVASGADFGACALTAEGRAYCWAGRAAPLELPGRHRFGGITRTWEGYCGYTPGGSAYCWRWQTIRENGRERRELTVPERVDALPG